jgi:uncharacterized protein (TIGR04141 family)
MPALTCYRIRPQTQAGQPVSEFTDVLDDPRRVRSHGPIEGDHFSAQLFEATPIPHRPDWADFVEGSFPGVSVPFTSAPSALLVVRVRPAGRGRRRQVLFAFPFGPAGRFLLRSDSYERGYGLRTALNILYPRAGAGAGRIRSIDSKRRAATIVRSRIQASEPSDFEVFDVNHLRDTVNKAIGIPADQDSWGRRIGGGDSITFSLDTELSAIGTLCRQIEQTHAQDDYKDHFDWIDYIKPIDDPRHVERLEGEVLSRLRSQDLSSLALAPPEIVDWEQAAGFHFHFDRRQGQARSAVTHSDLRLSDYLTGLPRVKDLNGLDVAFLRNRHIDVVDGSGVRLFRWPVWRCLVAELVMDGVTYILDEGDFFEVRADYLHSLDEFVSGIPSSSVVLPTTTPTTSEKDYNTHAATTSDQLLLLDRKLVRVSSRTTPIEICDLLTTGGHLIHVKRHFGSSDLSHLFSQGLVSAELLQSSPEFRRNAIDTICDEGGTSSPFGELIEESGLIPSEFEIVFAVAERWRGRTPAEALPFFSKINLREVAINLRARGFRVAFDRVDATPSAD